MANEQTKRRPKDSITDGLGVAIVTGQYAPGETLTGEVVASGQLKISRSAYREAVRSLIAKGLVESRTKTGTRVRDRKYWNLLDPDVLRWMFRSEPSMEFIRNLFELRMIIEPAAAALAAERRTGHELMQMGAALDEMARRGLATAEGREADQRFHRLILEATKNEALMTLASTITAAVNWTSVLKQRNLGALRDPVPIHVALYTTIADGQPEAAREAMTQLVKFALSDTEMSVRV